MNNQEIVQKLWNLCNVLRDDGISYQDYVTELTYILFLKMAKETGTEYTKDSQTGEIIRVNIPEKYRWDELIKKDGIELKDFYYDLLANISKEGSNLVKQIYTDARSSITKPTNLSQIIQSINQLDWYTAKEEGLGNLYEGLLEKNAGEVKSGAGQYFTPRVLIDVMTELINPKAGERCNDPAAGTFGFMIAADRHIKNETDELFKLDYDQMKFQVNEAFSGAELVQGTHRLALMNAMLHDINGNIELMDTLSESGKKLKDFDVVLSNPPFGTKKGGESANRDDLTFTTSNKQLNFLQHIYRSLNKSGKARCAVVLPDNVLFADGDGTKIREDLMEKCNLHTILRLPTGIFYAQGVKTNVLFFTRGKTDTGNTKGVWFYDLRTNMRKFGKTNPLKHEDFEKFIAAYKSEEREKIKDERGNYFTREQIAEKGNTLDLGLIKDDSIIDYENLPNPLELGKEISENLTRATELMNELIGMFEK